MQQNFSNERLAAFEELIGYRFKNRQWLRQALTHSSYSREQMQQGNKQSDYERLEFLGDAVLELCTSKMLFDRYSWTEGKLTKTRAKIVCEASLSYIAKELSFGEFIVMSYGEEKTGGRDRDSILCDVVEAVIGAVYQDAGMEEAKRLIERILFSRLDQIPGERQTDFKSTLQEKLQKKGLPSPEYRMVEMEGPPHDRIFTMELWLGSERICRASGRSKKAAAQLAAEAALKKLTKADNE